MFDVTSPASEKSVPRWFKDFRRVTDGPVVIAGSKVDCKDRRVLPKDITWPAKNGLEYFDISAKSRYNFEMPFLSLIRRLTGVADLQFVEPS